MLQSKNLTYPSPITTNKCHLTKTVIISINSEDYNQHHQPASSSINDSVCTADHDSVTECTEVLTRTIWKSTYFLLFSFPVDGAVRHIHRVDARWTKSSSHTSATCHTARSPLWPVSSFSWCTHMHTVSTVGLLCVRFIHWVFCLTEGGLLH